MTPAGTSFLDVADRIGCRLCREALWAGKRCNWLGWSLIPVNQGWVNAYRAQSAFVYDGIAGIAWFLAQLYRFTQDPIQKATLRGALDQLRRMLAEPDPSLRLGFYAGLAGVASVLADASPILEDESLTEWAIGLAEAAAEAPTDATRLDVMNGAAGSIPVLLDFGLRFHRDSLIGAAIRQADFLLEAAIKSDAGWSWDTLPMPGQQHLLGYAHGAAGIACAMLDVFRVTGESKYREAAMQGWRYEHGHYNAEARNWPDFRSFMQPQQQGGAPAYPVAWCHGAVGIGLSRIRMRQLFEDEELTRELELALDTTTRSLAATVAPGQGNFCLCHGNAGNAELLLMAADALQQPAYLQSAEAAGLHGIANYHQADIPWPCGVSGACETPNLMLGLAGIGYFYLRLHAPNVVPSILVLMKDFAGVPAAERVLASSAAD
jgi:lantibiotic modifying enzyme